MLSVLFWETTNLLLSCNYKQCTKKYKYSTVS
uniref:Uncharacterized protein n=1 Tax=Anguilla anguilla TaxID=7936 RepID=A0A0E9WFV1_ANGAN